MKRKKSLVSLLLAVFMLLALFIPGNSILLAEEDEGEAEEPEEIISTVGPDDGTPLEMWTFVELHSQFYAEMLNKWNEENPDKQLQITFTTYPFSDMHNKLLMANQAGEGAPDLVDIEINQFPNFLKGDVPFREMNDVVEPYKDDVVEARLDAYARDGSYYGIPTHVGATVMYYNVNILEQYDIDYSEIVTWEDFEEAGLKLKEASDGEYTLTGADTGGTDWIWVAMAEYGEDYITEDGEPNVNNPAAQKMLEMQQRWVEEGIAIPTPGSQIDTEEGFAALADERVVAFPKAMWYMSRFLNYLPEMEGQWAIAPCPVFEEGQPRSVGIGGTGTVVSLQSENADLAAEYIAYAKLSYEGNVGIWEILGFDTVNTEIWVDEDITQDESNKYIAYFVTNPFDVLNEIKDEIGLITVNELTPYINDAFNITILNNVLENGADVESELEMGQEEVEFEAY